ncbi:fumarylacetoacetate hydrolase family protein [Candidatus Bathyarchaeota archaeon]|nr:MAG: fumarylacetoacetate hydrolase family protein [Candidatus Bathyarchaeota archaeon]
MRLVRFQQKPGESRIGAMVENSHFVELQAPKAANEPLITFLNDAHGEEKARSAVESGLKMLKNGKSKANGSLFKLDDVTILPPIGRPSKIICMAGNFEEHLKEGQGLDRPFPISFLKAPTSLIGHRAPIHYPRKVKLLDYEVELATIVGKRCKDVSKSDALGYLAGFAVFNDISARDIQFTEMKRGFCNLGKNFDTFGPMGPLLVTPDQAGNPDDLGMELRVNGQTRQFASTKQMVFKTSELVEFFSAMTLEPGDIITSGTPAGVAIYRKPDKEPYLLKPGDIIESKIANLGRLQNTVVEEPRY